VNRIKIIIPYARGTWLEPGCERGLKTFKDDRNFKFEIHALPNSNLIQARNNLLWGTNQNEPFKNDKYDAFLFVDSDVEGSKRDFLKMWHTGEPLIFGAYPFANEELEACYVGGFWYPGYPGAVHRDMYASRANEGEIIEANWAGLGFTLIRREYLKKVPYPWVEARTVKTPPDYLRPAEGVFDDVGFCMKATEHGYKILLDCRLNLKHHKRGEKMNQETQIPQNMTEIKTDMDAEAIGAISLISSMAQRIKMLSDNVEIYQSMCAEKDKQLAKLTKKT